MLYPALRAVSRIALGWYYGDVLVQGRALIPTNGPLLVVANHPNALVDALLVGTTIPRRIRPTAKATLFEQPVLSRVLGSLGVVPLRRMQDEQPGSVATSMTRRNEEAFRVVLDVLDAGGAVLVFPEGISHDRPALAPMKSGASRIALRARELGIRNLQILPVGLVFEEKERPGSRVLVRIGTPIRIDDIAGTTDLNAARLTALTERSLRAVTLNFASDEQARRAVRVAAALAALIMGPIALGARRPFDAEVELAARIERATAALDDAPMHIARIDAFLARLTAFERHLGELGIRLEEARVSVRLHHGFWFVIRETLIALATVPPALLGWITHALPVYFARTIALRSLVGDPSRDQPAMRTIVLGALFIGAWYGVQALVVAMWLGPLPALAWILLIHAAGRFEVRIRGRLQRAVARARAFVAYRINPSLRTSSLAELDALLAEALALETSLLGVANRTARL